MTRCQLFIAMQLMTAAAAWFVDDVYTWRDGNDSPVVCVDFHYPFPIAWAMAYRTGCAVGTKDKAGAYSRWDVIRFDQ
jgi:hypothetical protein